MPWGDASLTGSYYKVLTNGPKGLVSIYEGFNYLGKGPFSIKSCFWAQAVKSVLGIASITIGMNACRAPQSSEHIPRYTPGC